MRTKFIPAALAAAFVVSLLGVASASAATEAGNRCSANTSTGPVMFVSLANGPGNPLPAGIPSAGVITRWTFSIGLPVPPEGLLLETLKVFRPTGLPQQLLVVGESGAERITGGTQTFSTRIPVKAGDLIGALAAVPPETGTVFCETGNPGDRVAVIEGGTASAGSTVTIAGEEGGFQNPIVVFVEPDADNDGFGDETQDQCPQSAAVQAACPLPVTFSTFKQVKKGSVTVVVTPSAASTVSVNGVVKLGKGKKAKLSAGTQILAPALQGKFKLFFTKKVKKELKELSRKKSLTLNVTISGTNITGLPTTKTLKVKLKGQAKP
jgi:hypothetical protein